MKRNPDVERWFAEKKPPNEKAMRRVREIILSADPRMTELLQYGTLSFAYQAGFASFVQVPKKQVTLMFNVGKQIPGRFTHLEGTGPNARFMRFAGEAEVEARAKELGDIARAWCELKAPAAKPKARGG
jgi:hypothetical protein